MFTRTAGPLAERFSGVGSATDEARHVLVPLVDGQQSHIRELALALGSRRETPIQFLRPVLYPEKTPLNLPESTLDDDYRAVETSVRRVTNEPGVDVEAEGQVCLGRTVERVVSHAAARSDVDALVLQRSGDGFLNAVRGDVADRLAAGVDADAVVSNGRGSLDRVASVLVPVAGGPHSGLAVDVGRAVAEFNDAWVELFHVVGADADRADRERGRAYLDAARDRLSGYEQVDTWLYEADDPTAAIVEQTRYYDATVLGAPVKSRLRRFVAGSTTVDVRSSVSGPVLTVHRSGNASWVDRWLRSDG